MKKLIFTVLAGFLATLAVAQEKPELVTDRPDQTEAPVLVPRGAIQVETGFQVEKNRENGVVISNYTYNSTLLKYGVNEYFELRLINEYLGSSQVNSGETAKIRVSGFSPLALGVKIKLSEEKGFWPQAAFIGHINLVSGSEEFAPHYTAADFRFTLAHALSEKLALSYNLGAQWNGETPDAAFLYTLSIAYRFTQRVGAFVEGYSFFPEHSGADNRIDAGITVLITRVVQWDISGGIGLSENAPDSFISTGLSFRLFK